ncbi:MAG: hypothetical protein P8183_22235 [Anaerolineae bacterium]
MPIILNNYVIPEKGPVNIDFQLSFEIKCTAVQAKRIVTDWLLNEISYLIGADMPTLVLHERPAWRGPDWLTLPGTKHKEIIGAIDVDVETGQINAPASSKAQLERYLHQNNVLMAADNSFVRELPPDYITNLSPPPQIIK